MKCIDLLSLGCMPPNLAIIDCHKLTNNKLFPLIEKFVTIFVSISSIMQDDPNFPCETDLKLIIIAFVSNLELLVEKKTVKNRNEISRNQKDSQ